MRAPRLLLLLMAAATASRAASPLARLNPWLSACDVDEMRAGGGEVRRCRGGSGGGCDAQHALAVDRLPALCALSPQERARRLRATRLHTCCERPLSSALSAGAARDVAAGGARCRAALHDLYELDALAARMHCAFADILQRYDCDQPFSVHTCDQCQDTYRRWACSTLVPFFVEESELRAGWAGGGVGRAEAARRRRRRRARHLERVGHLDRRRAGGRAGGRWVRAAAAGPGRPRRLKPCVAVCQLVEQHCPYFLPADRAPAYPTQYAGEPTFLCQDARIPETGEQANRSNHGPEWCCYAHCEDGVCWSCGLQEETESAGGAGEEEARTCPAVEERAPRCDVLAHARAAPAPRMPSTPLLVLAALLPGLLTLALSRPRTHRTLALMHSVRDSCL